MPARIGQNDIRGKALAFGAEAISKPRTEGGAAWLGLAGVHEPDRRFMAIDVGMHGANHSHVIHDAREMGQKFRNFSAGLALLLKFPRAAEQFLARSIHETESHLSVIILAAAPRQFRFGIEKIHMAWSAMHEKRNHGPGLRRQNRCFRS